MTRSLGSFDSCEEERKRKKIKRKEEEEEQEEVGGRGISLVFQ